MHKILMAALLAGMAQFAVWQLFERTAEPPSLSSQFESLSYAPFAGNATPEVLSAKDEARMNADMALLSRYARTVRTYTAVGAMERVPEIAGRHGLEVVVGAWIGDDDERNRQEIEAAVRAARYNSNVTAIVVGNEAILRDEITPLRLTRLIRDVKAQVDVPITTAEPWHVWLDSPILATAVDYLSVHALPYWEGIPAMQAPGYAFDIFGQMQRTFPTKHIVIAEFGWPSNGINRNAATTGKLEQAWVVRSFVSEAHRWGIAYNLIEAFDQPWKKVDEGSVGAYWGLFDADRNLKFALAGPIQTDFGLLTIAAVLLGAFLSAALLTTRRRTTPQQGLLMALAANAAAAGIVVLVAYPFGVYLTIGQGIWWVVALVLLMPLLANSLVRVDELSQIVFGDPPHRLILAHPERAPALSRFPKVSIHVPACRESPAMLRATLDRLARLDYPNFEVLVVVNNTPDETLWRPVEAHCQTLGERFRFVNLPKIDGFKGGALRAAHDLTAKDAEIIAVVDADYQVEPDWLRQLVPCFENPKVALVQAPQEHLEVGANLVQRAMNSEYAGFFDIGMVQRNEDNAIIIHGTMLLIRRSALEEIGGWGTDTITEDTELGLRLLGAGYEAHYTNRRLGRGVLPDSVAAYKKQRHRWVFGATQIVRKHWRRMLPNVPGLTPAQKRHFVTGWMIWLAEGAAVGLALLNLIAFPLMLAGLVAYPPLCALIPVLVAFGLNFVHISLLYPVRVGGPPHRILGAALAAMSLQFTVCRALVLGLRRRELAFQRTDKGGIGLGRLASRESVPETVFGVLLLAGAAMTELLNFEQVYEQTVFAMVMAMQSIPFLAAAAMQGLEAAERSRVLAAARAWLAIGTRRPAHS